MKADPNERIFTAMAWRAQCFRALLPLAVVLLPNMVWTAVAQSPVDALTLGLAPSLMLVFGLIAWSGRRLGLVIAVLLPFSAFVPLETYYIWNFQSPSNVHILGIFAETTPREALEYVGERGLVLLLATTVVSVVVLLLAVRSLGFAVSLPGHRIWRWLGLAATLPLIGLLASEVMLEPPADFPEAKTTSDEQRLIADLQLNVNDLLSPGFPLGIPIRLRSYLLERQRLADAKLAIDKVQVKAANAVNAPAQSVLVLVIGESATSTHWGANGYPRDTTPRVSALADAVSMRRAVTPWAGTRMSVPVILTGQQNPKSGLSPLTAPSVVTVLRAAGWKTFWLSNQSPMGMHDSVIALHASQADVARYFNGADYSRTSSTDDILLEPFRRTVLADPAPKKLFVMHLLGSHVRYKFRYPLEFDRFQPSSSTGGEDSNEALWNAYDNSILFTDYILGKMIETLRLLPEGVSASLLYISDHGQALPTVQCKQWGHSQVAESSFRVPAMVWLSPESRRRQPDAMSRLKALQDAPLHTSEVFDTVIDLAQVEFTGARQSKSWLSQAWTPQKRVINGRSDFDTTPLEGACQLLNNAG